MTQRLDGILALIDQLRPVDERNVTGNFLGVGSISCDRYGMVSVGREHCGNTVGQCVLTSEETYVDWFGEWHLIIVTINKFILW